MTAFSLRFQGDVIEGEGKDIVGPFVFHGRCDSRTGRLKLVKQYFGKHRVIYQGEPDGEGCIFGTWQIEGFTTGPFLMRPLRTNQAKDLDDVI